MSDHRMVVQINGHGNTAKQIKKRIIDALADGGDVTVTEGRTLGRPRTANAVGPPFPVRIPPDDDAGLKRIMTKDKVTKAAVIRRAIHEFLEREGECTNKQTENGEKILEGA